MKAAQVVDDDIKEIDKSAAERLGFFSDAVVAIAITLLAIDLPIPEGADAGEFWRSVGDNRASYIAFLISFIAIAGQWGGHHRVFRFVVRTDDRLRTLNMVWLFAIVVTPFATELLSGPNSRADEANSALWLRFSLYAGVQLLASLAFLAMTRHMDTHHQLSPSAPAQLIRRTYWHAGSFAAGFGLSIPLFALTQYAWALWIVFPVGGGVLHGFRRRGSTRSAS